MPPQFIVQVISCGVKDVYNHRRTSSRVDPPRWIEASGKDCTEATAVVAGGIEVCGKSDDQCANGDPDGQGLKSLTP